MPLRESLGSLGRGIGRVARAPFSWALQTILFWALLIGVIIALWELPAVFFAMLSFNRSVASWFFDFISWNPTFFVRPTSEMLLAAVLLAVEVLLVPKIIGELLEAVFLRNFGSLLWLRRMVMLQSIVSSIIMWATIHRIFWGAFPLLGLTIPDIWPERVRVTIEATNFSFWGSMYVISQALPGIVQPTRSPVMLFVNWLSSMPVTYNMMAVFWAVYVNHTLKPSIFQYMVMWQWLPDILLELVVLMFLGLLLVRLFLGSEDVVAAGGHHR